MTVKQLEALIMRRIRESLLTIVSRVEDGVCPAGCARLVPDGKLQKCPVCGLKIEDEDKKEKV